MHIYQKHILDELRAVSTARYSELHPDHIESSHFKYHLNQLIKDGYVEQHSKGVYGLSAAGQAFVDRLSTYGVNPKQSPKVITYTLLYDDENYYLYLKDKDPYRGLANFIGGKFHVGESSHEAAQREVLEKVNLPINRPTFVGVGNIRIYDKRNLLSHAIVYVFISEVNQSPTHKNILKISKTDLAKQDNLAPDLPDLLAAIEQQNYPFVNDLELRL